MKIGLLECDHVLPEFRHVAGDYREMFPALLPSLEWVNYDVCNGHFPTSPNECEGWLCTGSKCSVYDPVDWILRLKTFVRQIFELDKKYVGVCFGHQMLTEALGGKVEKAQAGWCVGIHVFEMRRQEDWMQPFQNQLNMPMMCQDQALRLPENSVVLASAPSCPVAIFQVGETMLGIQGHPEFPSEYEAALMKSRRERIGDEKTEAGLASLDLPAHRAVAAAWIEKFFAGN